MQFNDLGNQWEEIREECLLRMDEMGREGNYIGGSLVDKFEKEFSEYIGTKEAIGVSNGTDALKLVLQTLRLDDRDVVFMPTNTFIADYIAVKHLPHKKKPRVVLIDHDEHFCIDAEKLGEQLEHFSKFTRKQVVVAVHLYGHACDMTALLELKQKYNLLLIEDCSQSHGTKFNGKMTGSFGDMAVFSLYPGKNLGALGDAGIITTDNSFYADHLRALRNYGSRKKYYYDHLGHNNRLDAIQCIFLSAKLKHLDGWNATKRDIAEEYSRRLNPSVVGVPLVSPRVEHSYHIYCIIVDNREDFMKYLNDRGIPTLIHYPVPIHLTAVWEDYPDEVRSSRNTMELCDRIVSLPIHPFLSQREIDTIINTINSYENRNSSNLL